MIGFYNHSVILTYLGLALSIFGMTRAQIGGETNYIIAVLCLALAGGCDTFDGKIARAMKNRTKEAELFGVQIDSLCDCICFGVFPAFLAYNLGMKDVLGTIILVVYILAGVIRLAYFNVLDEVARNAPKTNERKSYRGLPITSIAIIFPILFLIRGVLPQLFLTILPFAMLAIAFMFVLDIKIKKPTNQVIAVYIIFVTIVMLRILGVF